MLSRATRGLSGYGICMSSDVIIHIASLLMRPELVRTRPRPRPESARPRSRPRPKICHETETKNYETKTETETSQVK